MNSIQSWLSRGRYGGNIVRNSEQRLNSVSSDTSISIDVLDAVVNDDRLESSLVLKALITDLKLARFGREWVEEREAIAAQTVDDFRLAWPSMRRHLLQNHLVALVSSLENYVMSLLVEFPPLSSHPPSSPASSDKGIEADWQRADSAYKKAVKANESASAAWVVICNQSGIPDETKVAVTEWGNDAVNTRTVDEMVLVRNAIVHRAGVIGDRLASHLSPAKAMLGKSVLVSRESLDRYGRAYWGFVVTIDPAL